MDDGELLEILTNMAEDLEGFRRETRTRLNAELSVLRKAVNAMLPYVPPNARSRLASEFREIIAQEAQGAETSLPKTMAILGIPNALQPLYPNYSRDDDGVVPDHSPTAR